MVLAICSGALRRYLRDLNCVPTTPLLAAVPVSLRAEGNTDMNTQASMVRISLASTVDDPMERLRAIRAASASAKAAAAGMKAVMPTDFPSLGAPWLISGVAALFGRSKLANRMPPVANVVISNVPGPKVSLYMAGARMLTYYPVSIAVHSMALNVTVQSYNGALDFGLIACRKAMPDLPELARYMQQAHQELLKGTLAAAATAETASAAIAAPAAKDAKVPVAKRKPARKATPKKAAATPPAIEVVPPITVKPRRSAPKQSLALVPGSAAAPSRPRSSRARQTA